jgi:hypothetical protein
VRLLNDYLKHGYTHRDLAAKYGLSMPVVKRIVSEQVIGRRTQSPPAPRAGRQRSSPFHRRPVATPQGALHVSGQRFRVLTREGDVIESSPQDGPQRRHLARAVHLVVAQRAAQGGLLVPSGPPQRGGDRDR